MISPRRVGELLGRFPNLTIGLVGDLFLDRYLDIDPDFREFSVETGLEAYQITRTRNSAGAMGTVINNLVSLGVGRLVPLSVVGDDGHAHDLLAALPRPTVETSHILRDSRRLTPTYNKPMLLDREPPPGESPRWRELNRLDLRNRAPLAAETEALLLARLESLVDQVDGWIVTDQLWEEGWGVVTPAVRNRLAKLFATNPDKLIFVDSRAQIGKFRVGILKPNLSECRGALVQAGAEPSQVDRMTTPELAVGLRELTSRPLACTLGPKGMFLLDESGSGQEAPAPIVAGPVDTVGAGDSATAGMVASLLAGADFFDAALVGNLVASITVRQIGTTGVATPAQLLEAADEWSRAAECRR